MKEKQCTRCKEIKSVSEFYTHNMNRDGYQCHCKKCQKDCRALSEEKKEEYRQLVREYNKERRKLLSNRPPDLKERIDNFLKDIELKKYITLPEISELIDLYEYAFLTLKCKYEEENMGKQINYMLNRLKTKDIIKK